MPHQLVNSFTDGRVADRTGDGKRLNWWFAVYAAVHESSALGEPIDDPLLLLSVLYAFWAAAHCPRLWFVVPRAGPPTDVSMHD
jgi:hypothetical protein